MQVLAKNMFEKIINHLVSAIRLKGDCFKKNTHLENVFFFTANISGAVPRIARDGSNERPEEVLVTLGWKKVWSTQSRVQKIQLVTVLMKES